MHMYMRMEFLTKEGLSANRRVVIVRIRKLTEGRPKIWLASFSRGFIRSYTVGEVYLSSHNFEAFKANLLSCIRGY